MKSCIALAVVLLTSGLALAAEPAKPSARTAREILDHTDDLLRGKSSHSQVSLQISTAQWSRQLDLEVWTLGKDRALARIVAPQKEKGTTTLRSANDVWNFLPKVNRVMKLPQSMMGGSWMGSHLTNDDLVKQTRLADDYTYEKTFEGSRDGQDVIELTLKPKPDAPVVWSRVLVTVRASDLTPLQIRYFGEKDALMRTLTYSEVKKLGGREVPTVWKVIPADKPGEQTQLVYKDAQFDMPIEESFFSLRTLQQ